MIANVNPVVTQQAAAPRGEIRPRVDAGAPNPGVRGAQAAAPNEETYTPTYFPGAIAPENASPISLPAGAEMRGIDFGIRPVSTVTISGQIIVPVSTGVQNAAAPAPSPSGLRGSRRAPAQQARPSPGGGRGGPQISVTVTRSGGSRGFGGFGGVDRTNVRPDGSFDVSGVVPGTYNLVAQARQDGQQYSARIKLEVGDGGMLNNISLPRCAREYRFPAEDLCGGYATGRVSKPSQLRVMLTPD